MSQQDCKMKLLWPMIPPKFHRHLPKKIHNFCVVELGSFYLDIYQKIGNIRPKRIKVCLVAQPNGNALHGAGNNALARAHLNLRLRKYGAFT